MWTETRSYIADDGSLDRRAADAIGRGPIRIERSKAQIAYGYIPIGSIAATCIRADHTPSYDPTLHELSRAIRRLTFQRPDKSLDILPALADIRPG